MTKERSERSVYYSVSPDPDDFDSFYTYLRNVECGKLVTLKEKHGFKMLRENNESLKVVLLDWLKKKKNSMKY